MYERTALPDGPRVITSRLPGARSVSMAAYVLAGSRLESAEEAGAAHFMEHITFKGTAAYPTTRAVSEAIEGVGGSFNAATDRESTVYWARVPLREAARGMDVLGELIIRPHLRGEEIESERAVIVELVKAKGVETRSPLPPGVELRQVFLDAFGILYLDFDKKIQALAAGDAIRTDLATSSIVLTLTTNFSEVKRVQFLSEGEELTLLTGGVDLRKPLQPRFPGEEAQPLGSQPREAE